MDCDGRCDGYVMDYSDKLPWGNWLDGPDSTIAASLGSIH
jgi:hypothetical protein